MASIKKKDRVDSIAGSLVVVVIVLLLLFLAPNMSEIADKGLAEFIHEHMLERDKQQEDKSSNRDKEKEKDGNTLSNSNKQEENDR